VEFYTALTKDGGQIQAPDGNIFENANLKFR
jgi:hypothetical protein